MLVFKLSSHTQRKFASLRNCQKRFSLLPSKSVYVLLSQNHSLKENDWLANSSSSSVIFNKHFSMVSFREKIIALLCVAGLSGNNGRREGTWELCSLSFPFANSECFQHQGSQRRGEKDRACSHWQNLSHLDWDKDLVMPCSIPSLGLRTSLAPHSRLALLRETALADNSALTVLLLLPSVIHLSYSSASFSLDTCTGDGSRGSGSYERKTLHNSRWPHLQHLSSCLCLPFPLHPRWLMVFASEVWWGLESQGFDTSHPQISALSGSCKGLSPRVLTASEEGLSSSIVS